MFTRTPNDINEFRLFLGRESVQQITARKGFGQIIGLQEGRGISEEGKLKKEH